MKIVPPAQWFGHKITEITEVAPGEYETTSMTGFAPNRNGTKRYTRIFKDPAISIGLKKIYDERLAVATDEVKEEAERILVSGGIRQKEARIAAEKAQWEAQRPMREREAYKAGAIF